MPLYEYECPKCGTFERMQKFSDPILKKCPTCASPVEKLLSAPAIQFKGSGWYITDYARKSGKEGAKEGGGESAGGGAGDARESKKDAGSDSSSKDKGGSKDSSSKKPSGKT